MNWKSWPYWVKGGSVGAIAGVLLAMATLYCNIHNPGLSGIKCAVWALPAFPLGQLLLPAVRLLEHTTSILPLYLGYIYVIADSVLFGALIGYLYGKFKNRKQIIN